MADKRVVEVRELKGDREYGLWDWMVTAPEGLLPPGLPPRPLSSLPVHTPEQVQSDARS